ncbi:MAG: type II toxin-antitoxin system VapC family toxin [Thermoanaerobaculia bacterium]
MSWLLDTNVISEIRKGPRCNPGVASWWASVADDEIFLSVLTTGEIRRGIESIRRRDRKSAAALERWLRQLVKDYSERLLPIDAEIADQWARMNVPDPLPVIDGLLAATAKVHDLILVTRNARDVERTEIRVLDPFTA